MLLPIWLIAEVYARDRGPRAALLQSPDSFRALTKTERPAAPATLSAAAAPLRSYPQETLLEDGTMRNFVKLMIALGLGAVLSGCVVAPVGPPRAYVGVGVVAPPVVVVRGYYGGYWHH